MNHEFRYLPEEISKQNVEDKAWVLFTAYIKMWKDWNEKKRKPLSKNIQHLKI